MPENRTGRVLDLGDIEGTTTALAEGLQAIGEAIKRLTGGRLKEEAIIVLIKESLPRGSKLTKEEIKAVLDATKTLGDHYTRKT